MDDELNHKAYEDVLDCKDPSMPDNEEYMQCYNFWRPLQRFPGDDEIPEDALIDDARLMAGDKEEGK